MSLRLGLLAACCVAAVSGPARAAGELEQLEQLQRDGQIAAALAEADRRLAGDSRNAALRFLKANLLADADRVPEAILELQRLGQDFPSLAEPHNNLATLHAIQGDYDKARAALEHALRLNPGYAIAHENLGDVHAALAAQAYVRAQRLEPTRTPIATKLAIVRQLTMPSLPSPAASALP